MLIVAGAAWAFTGALQSNSGTSDAANNAGDGGVISADGLTILLVGSDARTDADGNPLSAEELAQVGTEDDGGGINTDTIMLVHIPQGGGKATAVSLPRDTWIGSKVINQVVGPYADGTEGQYSPNKINSYYSTAKAYTEEYLVSQGVTDKAQIERESNEAGRTMLIRVVQAFTGMKVDHYAEVNLLGFYLLSNAIGGIPVCLNAAVNDPWSGADFAAGPQEVQGTAALAFVRQRHGLPEGDLDRVRRQQAFLSGAADKILSVGTLTNPSKLSDLVDAINRSVVFDKGFSVLTFAEQITNLSSGNITFETLPTTGPESSTDKDALATDPAAIKAFFAGITGGTRGDHSGAPGTGRPGVDHRRPAGRHHRRRRHLVRGRDDQHGRLQARVAGRRRRHQGRQRAADHRGALPAGCVGHGAAGGRRLRDRRARRGRRDQERPRAAGRRHRSGHVRRAGHRQPGGHLGSRPRATRRRRRRHRGRGRPPDRCGASTDRAGRSPGVRGGASRAV